MSENRISEKQLIFPALVVLAGFERVMDKYGINWPGITTTLLKNSIISSIERKASESDNQILKGRKDRKIEQICRNLISHKTLEKKGYVEINKDTKQVKLSQEGYKVLFDNLNNGLFRGGLELEDDETYKSAINKMCDQGSFSLSNPIINDFDNQFREKMLKIAEAEKTKKEEAKKTKKAKLN